MEKSRRGNFRVDLNQDTGVPPGVRDEEIAGAEAEWAAQWEPTIPCMANSEPRSITVELTNCDIVILRTRERRVRIQLVA